MEFNDLATVIYEQNKAVGWWDNPNRCLYECLQLISTEVAEATEAERKNLYDDHLPHRKGGEVELADALIRTLDLGGRLGLKYTLGGVPTDQQMEEISNMSVGKRHLAINVDITELADTVENVSTQTNKDYSRLLDSIAIISKSFGYDLEGATYEKMTYNKHRADHKRAARAATNGKQF